MPIYEYECKSCGHRLEELQGFSDPPLKKCPKCKKNKLEKVISLSSFKLEGTGWYATDYVKKPGIPPQAEAQNNPALSDKDGKANGSDSSSEKTVAESGSPSDPNQTYKNIQKETKKAKNKSKSAK